MQFIISELIRKMRKEKSGNIEIPKNILKGLDEKSSSTDTDFEYFYNKNDLEQRFEESPK